MLIKIIYLCITIFLYKILTYFCFPDYFSNINDKIKNTAIKMAYNIVYFYSMCQIKYNQTYKYISYFLKKYILPDSLETKVIKTKIEVYDTSNTVPFSLNFEKEYDEPFEKLELEIQDIVNIKKDKNLMIVSNFYNENENKNENDKYCINKKVLCTSDLVTCDRKCELSDISFIALYLNYKDLRYPINLKTENYNYYVIGNVINKYFLQYYINNVSGILTDINLITNDKKIYNIELMDQDVNMIYLDGNQSILIEKNGYKILNNSDSEESKDNNNELVEKSNIIMEIESNCQELCEEKEE
jgi:hypothetical protein